MTKTHRWTNLFVGAHCVTCLCRISVTLIICHSSLVTREGVRGGWGGGGTAMIHPANDQKVKICIVGIRPRWAETVGNAP